MHLFGVNWHKVQEIGMSLASNDTLPGRERNRRVEVWIKQGAE